MIWSNILSPVIFIMFFSFCEMYKILVVSHVPIKSHAVLSHTLVKLLLEAGHKITQIAIMPKNTTHPNLRQIDVSYNRHYFRGNALRLYSEISKKMFTATLRHDDVQMLLSDTEQRFDLVIAEWMYNDIGLGLAALYDCPMIWFSPLQSVWSILQEIDERANIYTTSFIKNSYSSATLMRKLHLDSLDNEAYKTIFEPLMALKGKPLPDFTDIMYLCSMVFVYSVVFLAEESKWPENYKAIGGYHISPKLKPLPKDIQDIMENAKNGVIYFSLGSHLQSEYLPDATKEQLLEMFSNLKQTIIWKYESALSNLPTNIYVTKWAPQQSILSHPNCALFITQGGVLSLTEAVYYAVPVIGIPIFGDQFLNVQKAVENGIGIKVEMSPTIVKEVREAIEELIHNSSYRKKVKEQSSLHHNRRMPPRAEVVYWVDHVIRKGVKKLDPVHTVFNGLFMNIIVIAVTVIAALKCTLRRSV